MSLERELSFGGAETLRSDFGLSSLSRPGVHAGLHLVGSCLLGVLPRVSILFCDRSKDNKSCDGARLQVHT